MWVVETAVMADPHLTVLLSSEDGKVGLPLSHLEGLPPLLLPLPLPLPSLHLSLFVWSCLRVLHALAATARDTALL